MQPTLLSGTEVGPRNHEEVSQGHARLFCNWSFLELAAHSDPRRTQSNVWVYFFGWELKGTCADARNTTFPFHQPRLAHTVKRIALLWEASSPNPDDTVPFHRHRHRGVTDIHTYMHTYGPSRAVQTALKKYFRYSLFLIYSLEPNTYVHRVYDYNNGTLCLGKEELWLPSHPFWMVFSRTKEEDPNLFVLFIVTVAEWTTKETNLEIEEMTKKKTEFRTIWSLLKDKLHCIHVQLACECHAPSRGIMSRPIVWHYVAAYLALSNSVSLVFSG